MKKNNLPNPTLHEIRAANPTATRMAIPKNAQSYAKTIERMAGVGYNRKREVNTLLEMQTKGNRIGGRVHPDTNTNRFGNLPINRMAVRQNKYLNPDIEQVQETLRTGNTNRRNIAKSSYVNGIAGKGFEGQHLVTPKRGRPYKGQPDSLPLIAKSRKNINKNIKKQEIAPTPSPKGKKTLNPPFGSTSYYDIYSNMSNNNNSSNTKTNTKTNTNTKINNNNYADIYGNMYGNPLPYVQESNEASTSALGTMLAGMGLGYGSQKLLNTAARYWPGMKSGVKTLGQTQLGPIEAGFLLQQLYDAALAGANEIDYERGVKNRPVSGVDYQSKYPNMEYPEDIPFVDISTIRVGDETLNPLQIKDKAAWGFWNAPENVWLQNTQFLNNEYQESEKANLDKGFWGLGQGLNSLSLLPQALSTASTSGLAPVVPGEERNTLSDPTVVIDNLLYGDTNPLSESVNQQKAIGRDVMNNPYDEMYSLMNSKLRPSEYMRRRNKLKYTNLDELPSGLREEVGRFAMPIQRRMKPTLTQAWVDIIDSLFGGNLYVPSGSPGVYTDNPYGNYDSFRASFGNKGLTNAMSQGNLYQVKGWNKKGQMQDLTAFYNNPNNFTNDITGQSQAQYYKDYGVYPEVFNHAYPINNIKTFFQQPLYTLPEFMVTQNSFPNASQFTEKLKMYNQNPTQYNANQLNREIENNLWQNEFMQGAQISNTYGNQFAQTPQEKTFSDRVLEAANNFGRSIPQKYLLEALKYASGQSELQQPFSSFNKSMNLKYQNKNETIKKSMSTTSNNKYFLKKGK